MLSPLSTRRLVSIILASCALLSVLYGWSLGRPAALADAPSDRLDCVSYAPFHKPGQTPFDKALRIGAGQIEADLTALARRFDCVRVYSVAQGLEEVPRVAQKLGLKVLLGAWIGREGGENEQELALAIELARRYPAAVRAVVVGNEALLHKEQPAPALRAYIERVKAALPGVPVSYADTWEFWLIHQKELLDAVSFATVHIIPYWENDPVGIGQAVDHVSGIYRQVRERLGGKAVMVGETGWPSFGRQRQDAEPSQVNQARFIREFARRMGRESIPYNVIEAFDQPWKRKSEGAVGGNWGLYTAEGAAKFPFRGPVAEAPAWSLAVFGAMAACFGALLVFQWRRRELVGGGVPALLAVGMGGGGAWAGACRDWVMASHAPEEWIYGGLYLALLVAATVLLGGPLAAWCSTGRPVPVPAPASRLLRGGRGFGGTARLLGALRIAFLFGAALVCLLLVFDPGTRDFPLALYALPATGFALLAWAGGRSGADLEEALLAAWIGLAGLWIAVAEHITVPEQEPWRLADAVNRHALGWAALCLLLAASVLGPALVELRAGQGEDA